MRVAPARLFPVLVSLAASFGCRQPFLQCSWAEGLSSCSGCSLGPGREFLQAEEGIRLTLSSSLVWDVQQPCAQPRVGCVFKLKKLYFHLY